MCSYIMANYIMERWIVEHRDIMRAWVRKIQAEKNLFNLAPSYNKNSVWDTDGITFINGPIKKQRKRNKLKSIS